MIEKALKKLTLCIENETKEEIVIIFADPTSKDLEKLILDKCVLSLVSDLIWTKKERQQEHEKEEKNSIEEKKEEEDWIEAWEKERLKRRNELKLLNNRTKEREKESRSDDEAIDLGKEEILDDKLDGFQGDKIESHEDEVKPEIDINIEVKAELSEFEDNVIVLENNSHCPTASDNKPINDNLEDFHMSDHVDNKNDIEIPAKNTKNGGKKRGKLRKSTDNSGGRRPKKARKLMKEEEGEVDGDLKEVNFGVKKSTNRYAEMEPKFSCEKCDKKFRRKNDLTMHIANVHLKVKHHCDQCEAVLSSTISLKQHIRMKHSGLEETHVCNVCGKNFTHKQYLDKHLQTHENTEKSYICKECGKSFGYKGSLKKHVQEHHENFFRYTCEECGQTFIDLLRYNMHMETTHQKGEKFTCNICGKEIIGKHRYKVHISRHPKSLKYVPCGECGEEIPETHMRFHIAQAHKSENWKYKCPYCPRKMEKAAYIRIHIRSHTGAKPYICQGCNKGFTTRESIKKHIKDFHNDDKSLMFFDRSLDVDENFKIIK